MVLSFGGPDNKLTSFEKAKVAIVPVPYGKTVSYQKGTEEGPLAILEASDNLELFDDELGKEIYTIGINTQGLLDVREKNPEEMTDIVNEEVSILLRQGKLPVLLGGEHTITIGAARALKRQYKDISILYFDAHCDLRNNYKGSKYNHACVARRLLDIAPVVEAGVRSLSKEEDDFLSAKNIKIIKMLDIMKNSDWAETIKTCLSKDVYISIDLDVFDTSFMPSVGNPEPGGIEWYEFLKAIRNIISSKNVVGFDVVELSPIKGMVAPDYIAAKLVYKMLGYIFP